ncbi:MAG: HDOD domain-containing protein [Candidatus Hydrogenedentota bacterium]
MSTGSAATNAPGRKRIGELLVSDSIITDNMLQEALTAQKRDGGKIVEVLIRLGYLTIYDFVSFLSRQPGIASIDLAHYQIPKDITKLIDKEVVIEHEVFPIDKMGNLLTVGMVCPLDAATISMIEASTGLRVKPILCSPEDIRGAIERYYRDAAQYAGIKDLNMASAKAAAPEAEEVSASKIETGLKLGNIVRMIQELKSLPALPNTVRAVQAAMNDKQSSATDVIERITMDPPIAAKVLSVANSAAYGFPNQVDSIDLAVALLGLRETYSIVLSAAVMNLFEKGSKFNYRVYWEEAMNVAAASQLIAKGCGRASGKSYFTAGLLHDIGRIALLETDPENYTRVDSTLTGEELIKAEQECVGLSHTEAGYELASNWNLPDEISEAIRFHHTPSFSEAFPVHANVTALAESWTRHLSLESNDKEGLLRRSADQLKALQMNEATASGIFDEVAALERIHYTWAFDGESA